MKKKFYVGAVVILAAVFVSGYVLLTRRSETSQSQSEQFALEQLENGNCPIAFESAVASAEDAKNEVQQVETQIASDEDIKDGSSEAETEGRVYPVHQNITATLFWIGENASDENDFIANKNSAWDDLWKEHYGGTDDPKKRSDFCPAKFVPKENPFYFALPYNDLTDKGERRQDAYNVVYWAGDKKWGEHESMLKNRWIKIIKNGKAVYAQWEDVGPFKENDADYVFGSGNPKSKENKNAGLDVSPAVRDYLGLSDIDKVNWQFVDEKDVPSGPWKTVVTRSQVSWN